MSAYSITVLMHSSLGAAALATYWVAALAKKGSGPHKLAGKIYVAVMIGLLVPAVPLSINVFRAIYDLIGTRVSHLATLLRNRSIDWSSQRPPRPCLGKRPLSSSHWSSLSS